MTKLSYKNLTKEQKNYICSGCGNKGGWLKVPSFCFEADCDWHDLEYFRGNTEKKRKQADKGFFTAMKRDVERENFLKRPFLYLVANTYFMAVKMFGWKFFHYGKEERNEKDLEEFIRLNKKKKVNKLINLLRRELN